MRRKTEIEPCLDNVLKLFSKRIGEFSGNSRRSYRKAYSSFQMYVMSACSLQSRLDVEVVVNWVINGLLQGLSLKTVNFYLDKMGSLYSAIGYRFTGGRLPIFKEVKKRLRLLESDSFEKYRLTMERLQEKSLKDSGKRKSGLLTALREFSPVVLEKEDIRNLWGVAALFAGVKGEKVKAMLGGESGGLKILDMVDEVEIDDEEKKRIVEVVARSLEGEGEKWFAMRLRPGVKYDDLISRFAVLKPEIMMPELFYPCEEIARRVGRKMVWKGRPVIRDVVFFKSRRSDIYGMFTKLYDLAWCYRNPGNRPGNYASIPSRAMEDFREAIGFLSPDYEVARIGGLEFKPGDEVIIVDGNYMEQKGKVLKEPSYDDEGNKIYRITLLEHNGRWDIGVDARLLRKV